MRFYISASFWGFSSTCKDEEWKCHDGRRCIQKKYLCDGDIHCGDGSDEDPEVCVDGITCDEFKWKCATGNQCIVMERVCDRFSDCRDGSDAEPTFCKNFTCPEGRWGRRWKCNNDVECISISSKCKPHRAYACNDGSDEWNCRTWRCPEELFSCAERGCILPRDVCTGDKSGRDVSKCSDLSDEDPAMCRNWTCSADRLKCSDNITCIHREDIMNGQLDCPDGSDEVAEYHTGRKCPNNYFLCANKLQCIQDRYVCDGMTAESYWKYGCQDGSDEFQCDERDCPPTRWKCSDNVTCIDAADVCDGRNDCKDKSDEHNQLCGCEGNKWPCLNGDGCIDTLNVCDGIDHCNDKSDELYEQCSNWNCMLGMWKCKDNQLCVPESMICDGKTQCYDTSDEYDCFEHKCLDSATKCSDNLQCISKQHICDGKINCKDGSDELCSASCLQFPLMEKSIVKRCLENSAVCASVEKYCDGVADCPLGSDEVDCSCSDWSLHSCLIDSKQWCAYKDWILWNTTNECSWMHESVDEMDVYLNKGLSNIVGKNFYIACLKGVGIIDGRGVVEFRNLLALKTCPLNNRGLCFCTPLQTCALQHCPPQ